MSRTSNKARPRVRKPISIWMLAPGQCRWPIEGRGAVLYCGEPVVTGCSYCATHRALAFLTPPNRGSWRHLLAITR
jgi:hypothetical protein